MSLHSTQWIITVGHLAAQGMRGRYWDRTSDLSGVKVVHASC
jgi:hypothetical protein